jgi:hypothetical protein
MPNCARLEVLLAWMNEEKLGVRRKSDRKAPPGHLEMVAHLVVTFEPKAGHNIKCFFIEKK